MSVFQFHLEEQGGGEFRRGRIAMPSKDEAEVLIQERELAKVMYVLSPEEEAELAKQLKAGLLSSADRARLLTHRQEQPYRLKKLVEA